MTTDVQVDSLTQVRERIEALDPYVGAGARGAGLSNSDRPTEYVQAFKDAVLDVIDEAKPVPGAITREEARVRKVIADELRARHAWLIKQSEERYYHVPAGKADECLYLAEKIEKGLTP